MVKNIIFDIGEVLIGWNPRNLYRKIFDTEEEIEYFLKNICTQQWNEEQDAGRSFAEATRILVDKYPEFKKQIIAYDERWDEMLSGPIEPSVRLLKKIKSEGQFKVLGLSNFSKEKFTSTQKKYDFLNIFDGLVVSGFINIKKPDPKIFKYLLSEYSLKAEECLFIDDSLANIKSAQSLGFKVIHFNKSMNLEDELSKRAL